MTLRRHNGLASGKNMDEGKETRGGGGGKNSAERTDGETVGDVEAWPPSSCSTFPRCGLVRTRFYLPYTDPKLGAGTA